MAAVTGFGGAFLRVRDPKALYAWYEEHLGIKAQHGTFTFPASAQRGKIALSFFTMDNGYFPTGQPAMINLQVDDLDAVLHRLQAAGVSVDPRREDYGGFGRFGWFTDPEGHRVELWQPAEQA